MIVQSGRCARLQRMCVLSVLFLFQHCLWSPMLRSESWYRTHFNMRCLGSRPLFLPLWRWRSGVRLLSLIELRPQNPVHDTSQNIPWSESFVLQCKEPTDMRIDNQKTLGYWLLDTYSMPRWRRYSESLVGLHHLFCLLSRADICTLKEMLWIRRVVAIRC